MSAGDISFRRILPLVVGGVIGLPLGVYLLNHVSGQDLKVGLGAFLIAYSIFGLAVKLGPVFANAGALSDGVVGFGGGIFGGIAGLSGPLATIWCGLRGWTKDQQRATYQSYNLIILSLAVAAYASQGLLTREVGGADTNEHPGLSRWGAAWSHGLQNAWTRTAFENSFSFCYWPQASHSSSITPCPPDNCGFALAHGLVGGKCRQVDDFGHRCPHRHDLGRFGETHQ